MSPATVLLAQDNTTSLKMYTHWKDEIELFDNSEDMKIKLWALESQTE